MKLPTHRKIKVTQDFNPKNLMPKPTLLVGMLSHLSKIKYYRGFSGKAGSFFLDVKVKYCLVHSLILFISLRMQVTYKGQIV